MKYIIYSDIDGTVYPHGRKIHSQTLKDIAFAQEKGIEFVLCTGNAYLDNVRDLAEKLNVRYCVTSNGASVYDRKEDKYIYESIIPKEKAQKILDFANKNKISADWWDKEKVYFNEYYHEDVLDAIQNAVTKEKNYEINVTEIKNDIFKIEFYDNEQKIDLMMDFLKDLDLQLARMKPIHVEVTHTGVSKGTGLEWLTKKLGSSLDKTMGIGDSSNDLPMFEKVNHSYAMANAGPHVKEKAKHHTSAVEQNGLGEAIIDFMYREKLDR